MHNSCRFALLLWLLQFYRLAFATVDADGSCPSDGAMSSSWTFRPAALASADNVYTTRASRGRLEHYYDEDNRRASDEGVEILSRPESAKIRTAQWNINSGWRDPHSKSAGLIHTIREADADVVVLNEYMNEVSFEKQLRDLGYSFVDCATVDFPTALATRLEVKEHREIRLSDDRSALLARLQTDGGTVWVIGTHVNFVWGEQRRKEMEALHKELRALRERQEARKKQGLRDEAAQARFRQMQRKPWLQARAQL